MSGLPDPSRCRAILVGIERYALGDSFDLPGAATDALRIADWLAHRVGVPPDRIELMLAPIDAAALETAWPWTPFTSTAFEQRVTTGLSHDADGGMLFVYWSGHGVIYRPDGQQYLVTTEADEVALRAFRFNDLSNVLVDARHAQFTHQVVVVDACRSPLSRWEQGAVPAVVSMVPADVDPLRVVGQCQLFACAQGQAGLLRRDQGSALTNALLDEFGQAAPGAWPDIEAGFRRIRERVETSSKGAQTPVVAFASDWSRGRLSASPWAVAAPLHDLLADVPWTLEEMRVHAVRSIRHGVHALPDLHAMIATLADLPSTDGVPPLGEFLARVVAALGEAAEAAPLRARLEALFKPGERAAIEARIALDGPAWLLQLWYQDEPRSLDAALYDPAEQPRVGFGTATRPLATDDAIGGAILAWIDEALDAIGDQALVVELCVPATLLEADIDIAPIVAAGVRTVLAQDYAIILRCTDRLKNARRRRTWLQKAPGVLKRVGKGASLVHWAEPGASRDALLEGFFDAAGTSPVWVGLSETPCAAAGQADVLDICFHAGLPALFWMRPRMDAPARAAVEARLETLLGQPPGDIPGKLQEWRQEQINKGTEHTAVLLDDPRRVPRWAMPAGVAGAMKG